MMLGAALCLVPLDRDNQLGFWKKKTAWGAGGVWPYDPAPATARCSHCRWCVPAQADGQWPPWCPHCGANFLPLSDV